MDNQNHQHAEADAHDLDLAVEAERARRQIGEDYHHPHNDEHIVETDRGEGCSGPDVDCDRRNGIDQVNLPHATDR